MRGKCQHYENEKEKDDNIESTSSKADTNFLYKECFKLIIFWIVKKILFTNYPIYYQNNVFT